MSEISKLSINDYCKMWYENPSKMAKRTFGSFMKVDAPLLIGTGATVYGARYGAQAFSYLNVRSDVWSLLQKRPWDKSGWRVITTNPTFAAGVTEAASLPDTVKPTFATLKATPKQIIGGWNVSLTMDALAGKDDTFDPVTLRQTFAEGHAYAIDVELLTDVDTLASNNMESLDRVLSAKAEEDSCGITAGDPDIYGVDRSAATTYDSQLLHNSNVDRDLTLSLINQLVRQCRNAGARNENLMFVTGWDTYDDWMSLLEAKQRFVQTQWVTGSINGVQTLPGVEGGFQVSTYDGIPIFCSQNMVKDTKSRVYLVDRSAIYVKVLMPTMYVSKPFPSSDTLTNEEYFLTIAEICADKFITSGKIRDLK